MFQSRVTQCAHSLCSALSDHFLSPCCTFVFAARVLSFSPLEWDSSLCVFVANSSGRNYNDSLHLPPVLLSSLSSEARISQPPHLSESWNLSTAAELVLRLQIPDLYPSSALLYPLNPPVWYLEYNRCSKHVP